MRKNVILAALLAAALLGSGQFARAITAAPSPAWVYAPSGSVETGNSGAITTPDLPFLVGAPTDPRASHFAFAGAGTLGHISMSADAISLAVPPLAGAPAREAGMLRDFRIADTVSDALSFHFGYDFDQGRRFDATDVRGNPAFAGLFVSPADFNATGFGETGVSAGASLGLGEGVSLNLAGALSGPDRPSLLPPLSYPAGADAAFDRNGTQSVLAGVDWKFAPWGGVALTASHQTAQVGFVGSAASLDALSLARSATNAVGATGRVALGGGWVTSFSYNQGVKQLDLRPAGNLLASNALRSRSYGIAVAKHGLFGDDSLGLAVSRPLDPEANIDLVGTSAADPFDGFIASNTHPILAGQASETDLQLGYVTNFMDGAFALQANAGYQVNAAGQTGNNGVTVLSRAKINF
ncbi:MAG TPA: hypothetical protein VGL35_00790 [Rhizomicrobium sp.]